MERAMPVVTVEQVKEQLDVLGVDLASVEQDGAFVIIRVSQCAGIAIKNYETIDNLRTELVDAMALLSRIQNEQYLRFQTASKQRHDAIDRESVREVVSSQPASGDMVRKVVESLGTDVVTSVSETVDSICLEVPHTFKIPKNLLSRDRPIEDQVRDALTLIQQCREKVVDSYSRAIRRQ